MTDTTPDGFANRIHPGSRGHILVAILTTDDFAANTVELSIVLLGPAGAAAVNSLQGLRYECSPSTH